MGHEAHTVDEQGMAGTADIGLMAHVQTEGRVILTMDKSVADLRAYPPDKYAGIVLFRPRSSGRRTVLEFVRQHLPTVLQYDLNGHLVVVSETGIRMR
jgi:predicted nuclease of predicted toxin-antitoxin system